MNAFVYDSASKIIGNGKIAGIVGGDHSVSLGAVKAHIAAYPGMGILQIDAHCDLRKEFEGFKYSHGSIMYNVLTETELPILVQVGVAGYCEEEYERVMASNGRIKTFFCDDIDNELSRGNNWHAICENIVSCLPQEVYISFDIDGLNPSLCPNTGTPVPGGLSYNNVRLLFNMILQAGKNIIGFDLVEVSPGKKSTWDADVGAHVLYHLSGCAIKSRIEK